MYIYNYIETPNIKRKYRTDITAPPDLMYRVNLVSIDTLKSFVENDFVGCPFSSFFL